MASARAGRILFTFFFSIAAVSLSNAADHLLISEVAVTSTDGEFVEIYNPTDSVIDLSNVYLNNDNYFGPGAVTRYYKIVTGDAELAGGGDSSRWDSTTP